MNRRETRSILFIYLFILPHASSSFSSTNLTEMGFLLPIIRKHEI